jgi:hypothetical protein
MFERGSYYEMSLPFPAGTDYIITPIAYIVLKQQNFPDAATILPEQTDLRRTRNFDEKAVQPRHSIDDDNFNR